MVDRHRKATDFLPLRGGAGPDSSIGLNASPAIMGAIAFLVGLFIVGAMGQKADPIEAANIRLFGMVFLLGGYGFMVLGFKGVFAAFTARRRLSAQTEPWLRDHPWHRTGSRAADAGIFPALLAMAVFAAFVVPFNTIWVNPAIWFRVVVGMLDLVLLAGVYEVVRRIVQRLRAGRIALTWDHAPFHPGERFEATLRSSRRIPATGPFQVKLRLIEQRWEGRENERTKQSFELVTLTLEVTPSDSVTSGTEARIAFDLPRDAPGTLLSQVEPRFWQLDITAPVAGPDFVAAFLVPVYYRGFEVPAPAVEAPRRRRALVPTNVHTTGSPAGVRFGAGIFGIIGLLMLLGAYSMGREAIAFVWTAEETEGVVLRNDQRWSEGDRKTRGSWVHSAVVQYHVDDRPYELTQSIASGSPTYRDGATLRVLYDPANPREARIRSFVELFFMPAMFGFMGSMCVGAAITIYLVFIRTGR